jgi:hypothetical protein
MKKLMEILDLMTKRMMRGSMQQTTNYINISSLDNYKNYVKGDVIIGGKTTI